MKNRTISALILVVMAIGTTGVWAKKKKPAPVVPLSEAGQKLEAGYAERLAALKAEIQKALPTIDEQKMSTYQAAREAEKAAEAERNSKLEALKKTRSATGLLNHRKGWIGRATTGVAEAKEELKQVEAMTGSAEEKATALKEAQEALAKIQANYDTAAVELKKAEEGVAKAAVEELGRIKDLDVAEAALSKAQADTQKAISGLGLESCLGSDKLDAKLAEYVVLFEATPNGLAAFAEKGRSEEKLVSSLLKDADLMKQMLLADGAADGNYGDAMRIYTTLQKQSKKARKGNLQRLALAVSLEHATPRKQRSAVADTEAPDFVDPVSRYQHFEKAFLDGELDEGFEGLTVWDYRMVVNGEEPDEILAWGRRMLRNYRPDHIDTSDERWRYVKAVKTDVRYGSQDNKYDKPELQFFQNIMMNGGVCGRRAFFGRFILRSFGVPTTARPQPGHAALARRTPEGWSVCLGGGWGIGSTKTRYKRDKDFLANSQARVDAEAFEAVKRAQWIGDVAGENRVFGFLSGDPDFWYGLSLYRQRAIIEEAKAVALAAVGTDIGEANESKVKDVIKEATISDEDKAIIIGNDGTISIPAVATSKPQNSTEKIKFMKSYLGGMQLHHGRLGPTEDFEYTLDLPEAGTYLLTARVVTTSWKQNLVLSVNGAGESVTIPAPFTVGEWGTTEPVEVKLVKGKNVLNFSRPEATKGVSIKDFTLTPAGNTSG